MGGIIIRPGGTRPRASKSATQSRKEWLEAKVRAARAGLEDGTNRVIDEDEWKAIRAARQARRDAE